MIKLCKRLNEIAVLCNECNLIMDIGSDHGLLPVYLLQNKKAERAIITDISEKSLNKAKKLIDKNGLSERAFFYCTDGFKNVEQKPETVIIAGMGGMEIIKILTEAPYSMLTLILQPMKDAPNLRQFLEEKGYSIITDRMICSCGKYYDIIKAGAKKTKIPLTEDELQLGKTNITEKSKDFFNYLKKEKDRLQNIVKGISGNQSKAHYRLDIINKALNKYYSKLI